MVTDSQIKAAITALRKFLDQNSKKSDLFADDASPIHLIISLQSPIGPKRNKPKCISVPHAIYPDSTSVCLVVRDPQRTWKDKVSEEDVTCVKRVIGVDKLRRKYKPFEARRELMKQYDVFMADEAVLPILPKLLGKNFFVAKRLPLPLPLKATKPVKKIIEDAAFHSAWWSYGGGDSVAVRIAYSSQEVAEIVSNVQAVVTAMHGICEEAKILSIGLKTTDSLLLPLWEAGDDEPEETSHKKRRTA